VRLSSSHIPALQILWRFADTEQYLIREDGMERSSGMTKKEIVRSLILSPCYLKIKLKERAKLVQKLSYRKP
jgi:hypothetical protein